MKAFNDYKFNKQVQALRKYACFTNCPQYVLELMFMNMSKVELKNLNTVYKEGDKPVYLYFIKNGIIEVRSLKWLCLWFFSSLSSKIF